MKQVLSILRNICAVSLKAKDKLIDKISLSHQSTSML